MKRAFVPALLIAAVLAGVLAAGPGSGSTSAANDDRGRIAYVAFKTDGGFQSNIAIVNPDGTGYKRIEDDGYQVYSPRLSPDGTQVMYDRYVNDGWQVYVVEVDGNGPGEPIIASGGSVQGPQWSPDGNHIIWADTSQQLFRGAIVEANADGSGEHEIASEDFDCDPLPGTCRNPGGWRSPVYSPDGKKIAYIRTTGGTQIDTEAHIWIMNADGSNRRQVDDFDCPFEFSALCTLLSIDWSPDGRQLAVHRIVYTTNTVAVIDVAGGDFRDLVDHATEPSWSPDGREIAYKTLPPTGASSLMVMDADGSNQRSVIADSPDFDAGWSYYDGADWGGSTGQCTGTPAISRVLPASEPSPTPSDNDRDGDNLPNHVEEDLGLNPDCQDTDGDGLLDPWEVDESVEGAGFDLDEDGTADVQRDEVFGPYDGECGIEKAGGRFQPLGQWCSLNHPPDPLHKDAYMEIDWQDCFSGDCPELVGIDLDPSHHAPNKLALFEARSLFHNAPVENPDETQGVNLNILVDEALKHLVNCDQHDIAERDVHFGTKAQQNGDPKVLEAKALAVRYGWSGHSSLRDDLGGTCPLPSSWSILSTGLGFCCLPEYDISPFGSADPGGKDVIFSLAVSWVCQLYTYDLLPDQPGVLGPCFRTQIFNSGGGNGIPIPGLFPAKIASSTGGDPIEVALPQSMLQGIPPPQGAQLLWGKTLMNLLGRSMGVGDSALLDHPDDPSVKTVRGYSDWTGMQFAPPVASSSSVLAEIMSEPPALPNFDLVNHDQDGDGVNEGADTCPGLSNADQMDLDGDGQGDACDGDDDGDFVPDSKDAHLSDTDNDATPNAVDTDDDGDGVADVADICQLTANADQLNTDGDAAGDACDSDDDADGLPDLLEQIAGSDPAVGGSSPEFVGDGNTCTDAVDNDGDGQTDAADTGCMDADGDTVPDLIDNCPGVKTENLLDSDGDGQGNVCEPVGEPHIWGDADCSGALAPRDSQAGLKHFLGQAELSQTPPCPAIGSSITFDGVSHLWGDNDCNGSVAPRDGQAGLKHFLGQAELSQTQPCPVLGTTGQVSP